MDNKITAYRIFPNESRTRIEPASRRRQWMTETNSEFAYRCLPLNMANQHGWCVYSNNEIEFGWNGNNAVDAITVTKDGRGTAASIFGYGIITFHIMHLIQTSVDMNLYVSGPPNHFKPGIQALTGLVETDWSPFTFTMNWQITQPHKIIKFTPDDPICFFFPVPRGQIEETDIEFADLASDPVLQKQHEEFSDGRVAFYKSEEYQKGSWEKHYFQGKYPDGSKCPFNHQTKLNLKAPE